MLEIASTNEYQSLIEALGHIAPAIDAEQKRIENEAVRQQQESIRQDALKMCQQWTEFAEVWGKYAKIKALMLKSGEDMQKRMQ